MNPQDQQPPQGNFNQQQYDFITNPAKPPKKSLFSGANKTQRLIIMVVGGLGLLTILILVFSLIFGGGGDAKTEVLRAAKQQNILITLSDNAIETSNNTKTKTLASATKASLRSDNQILIAKVSQTDKVPDALIAGTLDEETENKLANAAQNGQYDAVFEGILKSQLESYQQQLRAAANASSSESTQALLSGMFDNSTLLLKFSEK